MIEAPANARQVVLPESSTVIAWPMQNSSIAGTGPVELDDLSRLEGEGGPEAPTPDLVDVPLNNGIWRRLRRVAHQEEPR